VPQYQPGHNISPSMMCCNSSAYCLGKKNSRWLAKPHADSL